MNKLFTRISMALVGIAMAVGVGVAAGVKTEARGVRAVAPDINTAPTNVGNWQAISAISEIEESKPYLIGYEVAGVKYFAGDVSSKTWQCYSADTDLSNARTFEFVSATGGDFYIKLTATNYLIHKLSSKNAASTEIGTATSGYTKWTPTKDGNNIFLVNNDGNNNDGRILSRASSSGGAGLKGYASGSVPSSYPYPTIYKYVDSVPDTVTKNADSFNVDLGKTLNLAGCVTTTGTSDLVFSAPVSSNEFFTIVGSILTPIKVGGPFTVTATKGSASDTFDVSVVLPSTQIAVNAGTFTEITGSSYDSFTHVFDKLNDLKGGVTSSTTIEVDQVYPNQKAIQMSKSRTHILKNTTAVPGHIRNMQISFTNSTGSSDVAVTDAGTPNVYAKAASEASSSDTNISASVSGNTATYSFTGDDYKFFYINMNPAANTVYFSLVINYEKSYEDNAKDFSEAFISNLSSACADQNANNKAALIAEQISGKTLWQEQKEAFEALPAKAKEKFGSSADATIVRAKTLYLHCVARYDLDTWTNAPAAGSARISDMISPTADSSTTITIVIISAISLIAVSSYFVIRRRKENN